MFEEQVNISRNLGDMNELQLALNNVGCAFQGLGDMDKAMATHKEQEAVSRKYNLPYGIALSLFNQADILKKTKGDIKAALAMAREALTIFSSLDMTNEVRQVEDFITRNEGF